MIKIAVCDDEENIRNYLSALIRKQGAECDITEYASGNEYLTDGAEFDLIFLDIEMEDADSNINGMTLARKIRSKSAETYPVIIFVTGYERYVYDAFDVGALQYLIKPIDEQKFAEVYEKAVKQILTKRAEARKTPQFLMIQFSNITKAVPLDDLYYIESRNHKAVLHLKDEEFEYYARIGDLEQQLQGQFFRIHKGYLINLSYVDEYSKLEVTLSNGERLLISKYKYQDFVRAYMRFMEQCE